MPEAAIATASISIGTALGLRPAAPYKPQVRNPKVKNLKTADSHFAFGKNWASYATLIGDPQIEEAIKGLLKLIPAEDFQQRSFLDIGCGSGLHALAASRLGVARITAVDIDADSVATARHVLTGRNLATPWHTEQISVFNLDPGQLGTFDIVYSWGVLHHTGSMWEAVAKAAAMVAPNGLLAIAIYRKTRMDAFWKIEKRLYAHAPGLIQALVRTIYVALYRLAKGGAFRDFVKHYRSSRGMDFYHDVHDWLGGYPYETALAPEIDTYLGRLGFRAERIFARPLTNGILGSGCDEYVYRRQR
jgi:2-polyprenyl-6-hydroxyphenyl methylase/3-demethylubiquinone-9 3-methyltransferase